MMLVHPFMVHFTITCTLLAMIRWAGIPFLEFIPEYFFKWGLPPLLLLTVLSGQYSLGELKDVKPDLLSFARWHRVMGIGAGILATWVIFRHPAKKPDSTREGNLFFVLRKNLFSLPGLAILLILMTATIGGILVHTFRVG
ncbi:MAG: hypothetical protein M0Z37_04165, partial [Nitrospiraceae bacterium]|nr:hypothetical protein [Nitrospiraceae bacterium]